LWFFRSAVKIVRVSNSECLSPRKLLPLEVNFLNTLAISRKHLFPFISNVWMFCLDSKASKFSCNLANRNCQPARMHKEEIKVFSFLFGGILMIISSSRIYGILIKTAQRARPAEAEIVSWPFQNTSFRHVNSPGLKAARWCGFLLCMNFWRGLSML